MFKPKIVVLYDRNGVCWWRSWLPHMELQRQGLADVRFVELKYATGKDLTEAVKDADIIQRISIADMPDLMMMKQYRNLGVKFAVDYDDLHFNISPWNPKYKVFGTEEVQLQDGTWLWRDGQDGFNIKTNKQKFWLYKTVLQEADIITTTTLYLKGAMEEISEYSANCRVLPNAIDFDLWKPVANIREKYADEFRFGWSVSGSHGEDWIFVRPILIEFLKSHPKAKFVTIGDTYLDIKKGMEEVKDQIEWYPFSDLWEGHYTLRMPLLGLDAAIAPLANTEFNRCKSPLKWEEYTSFGWPTIAQNMEPYSSHIINNETGLLAKDKNEWLMCLNLLYGDKTLRNKLRFNALCSVKQIFDIKEVAKEWAEMYQQMLNGDKASAIH